MQTCSKNGETFRIALRDEFARRCKRNPRYSIRSFANFLEADFSTVAKILNGKRSIGKRTIQQFGDRLGMPPERIEFHVKSIKTPTHVDSSGDDYRTMNEVDSRIVSDWYHYAILELMRLPHFETNPHWIARKLGLTHGEISAAIDRLVRCGFLEMSSTGEWKDLSGERTTNIKPMTSSAARRTHQKQVLQLAVDALDNVAPSQRDQTSMTMAVDKERLDEARDLITRFRRDMAKLMSRQGNLNEVYHLAISLYPVTHSNGRD